MLAVPIRPMLATAGPLPTGPGWTYEFKWDGVRVIAEIVSGTVRLYARSGTEVTVAYPEVQGLGEVLDDAVLDGEMVVFDAAGRPSFELLAERMHVRQPTRAARLAATRPATFLIFDLLRLGDTELLDLPYDTRRSTLEELRLDGPHWQVPPAFDDGPATLAASAEHGLEGVMAKRSSSVYRPGSRTTDWIKVKSVKTIEVVVGGWRPGERPLGALLVGVPAEGGGLRYKGRVGGGIAERTATELLERMGPLRRADSPFVEPIPRVDARGAVWVEPTLVVEVAYGNQTAAGRLRFPRFVRLRPDLAADDLGGEPNAEK